MTPFDRWEMAYSLAETHDLPAPQAAVVLALLYHDGEGRGAWPSVATLTHRTRFGRRAVQMALRALEARGLVAAEVRNGTSTRYRVRTSRAPGKGAHLMRPPLRTTCAPPAHLMRPNVERNDEVER